MTPKSDITFWHWQKSKISGTAIPLPLPEQMLPLRDVPCRSRQDARDAGTERGAGLPHPVDFLRRHPAVEPVRTKPSVRSSIHRRSRAQTELQLASPQIPGKGESDRRAHVRTRYRRDGIGHVFRACPLLRGTEGHTDDVTHFVDSLRLSHLLSIGGHGTRQPDNSCALILPPPERLTPHPDPRAPRPLVCAALASPSDADQARIGNYAGNFGR